jgi:hypothetical protein
MLISKPQLKPLSANNVPRDVLLGFLGQKEQLVGTIFQQCSFDVELAGSGTAGTRPAYGDLMLAARGPRPSRPPCASTTRRSRAAFQSVSLYWYDDGALHKLLGARGDVSSRWASATSRSCRSRSRASTRAWRRPREPVPTLTGFKVPQVVSPLNTLNLTFGGTHSGAAARLPSLAAPRTRARGSSWR